jgi:hypothetical protein
MQRKGSALGRRGLALAVGALVVGALVPAAASARDTRDIRIQDRCDPATFDAAVGPGTCVRDLGVTFDEFLGRLNPHDGGHGAWRFSREATHLDRGQALELDNVGGEVHSFTEVQAFGAGIVDILNAALPPGTAPAVPIGDPHFLPSGGTLTLGGLERGTHRFQCLIHPWMRSTVTQR